MFDTVEPSSVKIKTGSQVLDIVATFSPRPRWFYILAKMFLAAWAIAIMHSSIATYENPSFWLAYLTNQGWVFTVAYFFCSLLSALYLAKRGTMDNLQGCGGLLVKSTWALFAIALPAEIVIAILFWVLEFKGNLTYVSVMTHGGGIFLLVFDGFIFSRIPLRMKQFLLFETFSSFYILWNIIHAFSGIGNPNTEEGVDDDDAIYGSMNWNDDPGSAGIVAVSTLVVLNPIVFLVCRCASRILPKRLLNIISSDEVDDTYDNVESMETV
eukprot:CAMPEP_0171344534 /NCGR_PEP_ID=MMETSP0878-20121228/19591_1 /TAXON_ID=67004 /ORGANISM="Thalassiosira weissflogii, Strain CCMP1336" /LENGTH=268 /DNA_ID=CAMNT_0011847747 /DNA_START=76 /DNA_END=882 /DNA_ORIENTATION=+